MAFTYSKYQKSDTQKKKDDLVANYGDYSDSADLAKMKADRSAMEQQGAPTYTSKYEGITSELLNNYNNRKPFSYDVTGDALYQMYKDQYMNQGKLAMADAIGQASAMTGGYGNSYAANVGNQAYQGYLTKLNDVVPELYQMAYNRYNQEGQDILNRYNLYNQAEQIDYGKYRDALGDYNTALSRLDSNIYNQSNMEYSRWADQRDYLVNDANNNFTREYGIYNDDYSRAFAAYQQQVSEDQAKAASAAAAAKASSSSSGGLSSKDLSNIKSKVLAAYDSGGYNAARDIAATYDDDVQEEISNYLDLVRPGWEYNNQPKSGGSSKTKSRYAGIQE